MAKSSSARAAKAQFWPACRHASCASLPLACTGQGWWSELAHFLITKYSSTRNYADVRPSFTSLLSPIALPLCSCMLILYLRCCDATGLEHVHNGLARRVCRTGEVLGLACARHQRDGRMKAAILLQGYEARSKGAPLVMAPISLAVLVMMGRVDRIRSSGPVVVVVDSAAAGCLRG